VTITVGSLLRVTAPIAAASGETEPNIQQYRKDEGGQIEKKDDPAVEERIEGP